MRHAAARWQKVFCRSRGSTQKVSNYSVQSRGWTEGAPMGGGCGMLPQPHPPRKYQMGDLFWAKSLAAVFFGFPLLSALRRDVGEGCAWRRVLILGDLVKLTRPPTARRELCSRCGVHLPLVEQCMRTNHKSSLLPGFCKWVKDVIPCLPRLCCWSGLLCFVCAARLDVSGTYHGPIRVFPGLKIRHRGLTTSRYDYCTWVCIPDIYASLCFGSDKQVTDRSGVTASGSTD